MKQPRVIDANNPGNQQIPGTLKVVLRKTAFDDTGVIATIPEGYYPYLVSYASNVYKRWKSDNYILVGSLEIPQAHLLRYF